MKKRTLKQIAEAIADNAAAYCDDRISRDDFDRTARTLWDEASGPLVDGKYLVIGSNAARRTRRVIGYMKDAGAVA